MFIMLTAMIFHLLKSSKILFQDVFFINKCQKLELVYEDVYKNAKSLSHVWRSYRDS